MICNRCAAAADNHTDDHCQNSSSCDCQHKPSGLKVVSTGERTGENLGGAGVEANATVKILKGKVPIPREPSDYEIIAGVPLIKKGKKK